jgi:hypothetical protein
MRCHQCLHSSGSSVPRHGLWRARSSVVPPGRPHTPRLTSARRNTRMGAPGWAPSGDWPGFGSGLRPRLQSGGHFDGTLLLASALEGGVLRGACELRRLVRRCTRPAAGTCQYCGRAFCSDHGILVDDGQEICGRSRCQRKRIDLERHLRYKAVVRQRNTDNQCGVPGCQTRPGGQCSRCRGFFCGRHLANHDLWVREGRAWVRLPASMCEHCWRRSPLWSQL